MPRGARRERLRGEEARERTGELWEFGKEKFDPTQCVRASFIAPVVELSVQSNLLFQSRSGAVC